MFTTLLFPTILALSSILPTTEAFVFQWASPSYQCYTQTLSWSGGQPPFTAFITPNLQRAFVYPIPASAFDETTGEGSYDITMQLYSGIGYVIWMSDATGVGTGGSSMAMTVNGYGESACLDQASLSRNQTEMSFSVETPSANIIQCKRSFRMDWDQTVANAVAPFNMTVISLDQTFDPFNVDFGSLSSVDWLVNLKAGSRFTFMMNDATGYATGGTGSWYQVNSTATGDTSCIDGGADETITPGVTHTQTTTYVGQTSTVTETDPGTGGSGGKGDGPGLSQPATYAVAVIGALVGIGLSAAIGFGCFIWRRRKRNRLQRNGAGGTGASGAGAGGLAGSLGIAGFGSRRHGGNGGGSGNQRYAHPNDAVDLFDGDSTYHGGDFSPIGAPLAVRSGSESYLPVPYTPGGESPGGQEGGHVGYPGSAVGTMTSAGQAGRGTGRDGERWRDHGDYPPSNPFEGRELGREETLAALVDRKYPYPHSNSETTPTSASAGGARSPPNDSTGTPLLQSYPPSEGTTPMSATAQRKLEEMNAEIDQARAGEREQQRERDNMHSNTSSTWSGTGNDQHQNSTTLPVAPGTFRVTNAGEGDPVLAAPAPSSTLPRSVTSAASGQQRRRRFVDPFDTAQPRFVRHADAGRVGGDASEEIIDLPPLYTDLVPRSTPSQADDLASPQENRTS